MRTNTRRQWRKLLFVKWNNRAWEGCFKNKHKTEVPKRHRGFGGWVILLALDNDKRENLPPCLSCWDTPPQHPQLRWTKGFSSTGFRKRLKRTCGKVLLKHVDWPPTGPPRRRAVRGTCAARAPRLLLQCQGRRRVAAGEQGQGCPGSVYF